MSDTPRTDAHYKQILDDDLGLEYNETELRYWAEKLERELAEAQAEVVRLKGEAESWEKVFDRTCEHLADAKEQLRLCNVDQFTTAAELAEAMKESGK